MITACILALTLNVYHEARGEPLAGQYAVAEVTMNRVASKHYPDDCREVVTQRKQFSWTNGKNLDSLPALLQHQADLLANMKPQDVESYRKAEKVARSVLADGYKPKAKHLMFHTTKIKPYWSHGKSGVVIGSHKFY